MNKRGTRARRSVQQRPICTYEVTYQFFAYEFIETTYRLRCPKLLRSQVAEHKTLHGDVSIRHGNKWNAFEPGVLPGAAEYMSRIIRQYHEPTIAAVPTTA